MLSNPLALLAAPIAAANEGSLAKGTFTWGDTLNVTFCGISIVFSMLVILVLVIMIFGFVMKSVTGRPAKKAEKPAAVSEPKQPVAVNQNDDSDEVIAVITAAVNSMYENSGVKPVIRSIRQNKSKAARSSWASAGVMDNTRAF